MRPRSASTPTACSGTCWVTTRSAVPACARQVLWGRTRSMPDALVERDDYVMTITMNRPKRLNALSGATLVRMYDAFVEASADESVRAIILTGAEGNFTSGADLKAMAGDSGPDADTEIDVQARMAEDPDLMWKALLRHYRPTKP